MVDLSLPKKDGLEVLEAIRGSECFDAMPVVVASSSGNPPAALSKAHLRVARYIIKPPELEEFLQIGAVLKEILNQSRTRQAGI